MIAPADDLTAIPAWMRRAPEDGARRRRRRAKIKPVRTKVKRWDRAARYRVDLGPAFIGFPAGQRAVLVLIGRKWVSIKFRNKRPIRMPLAEWAALKVKERLPS